MTDLAIARAATLLPMEEIGAKLAFEHSPAAAAAPGKLILITAISPTPAGEGKNTTTIAL